jgi:acyl-CoA thioesterase
MKADRKFIKLVNESPYAQLLGMKLTELEDGFARVKLPYHEKLLQPFGRVHGGAIYSMADYALGWAAYSMVNPEEEVATIEMKMNYIGTIKDGVLIAEAKVIHCGNRTILVEVSVRTNTKKLIATATGTLIRLAHNGSTPHPHKPAPHRKT